MKLRIVLSPLYPMLKLRHALFNKGVRKVLTTSIPTICVGNITVGGTGKTPHTEMILRTLLGTKEWKNKNLAVLSRGYKRKSKGFQQVMTDGSAAFFGDEPLQIKRNFPNVTVAVDRSRKEGCEFLRNPNSINKSKQGSGCRDKKFPKADLIILDDAFQHRQLKSYFNIILMDYYRPVYKDGLIPFGKLRDLPERLRFADTFIITKCPTYLEDKDKSDWLKGLGITDFDPLLCKGTDSYGKSISIFFTSINYLPLAPVFPAEGDSRYIYSQKLILFTGIAKDTPLRRYLSDSYEVVKRFCFSDHHKYSGSDIRNIVSAIKANPTAVVATTQKDSQRVRDYKKIPETLRTRLFQVPIEVAFLSQNEKERFESVLINALREYRSGF